MTRRFYLVTLWVLQGALAWKLVPACAIVLLRELPVGSAAPGWPALTQVAAAGISVLGVAISLGFPGLAAMRHWQRGWQRFSGLPDWGVALALSGAGLFLMGVAMHLASPFAGGWAPGWADAVAVPAGALVPAGIALMSAGVLAAELLRRSVPAHAAPDINLRIVLVVDPASPRVRAAPAAITLQRAA